MSDQKIVYRVGDDAYRICPECQEKRVLLSDTDECYQCRIAAKAGKTEDTKPKKPWVFGDPPPE